MDRVVAAILPRKAYRASPRSSPSSPAEAEARLSRIHDAAADDYDMAANRFPRRTSFALETMGFSNPGIGSTAGRTPQAQITASGFRDATYASSAVVFSRTSTPLAPAASHNRDTAVLKLSLYGRCHRVIQLAAKMVILLHQRYFCGLSSQPVLAASIPRFLRRPRAPSLSLPPVPSM